MAVALDLALYFGAGLVLVALGVAVLALRWRHASAVALGLTFVGLGGLYLAESLTGGRDGPAAFQLPGQIVLSVGLWALVLVFPRRLGSRDLPVFLPCAAIVSVLYGYVAAKAALASDASAWDTGIQLFAVIGIGVPLLAAILWFPLLAAPMPPGQEDRARSLSLVSLGLALFVVGNVDGVRAFAQGEWDAAEAIVLVLIAVVPPVLWSLAARGAHARLARNTAILWSGTYLVALLVPPAGAETVWGVGRTLGALLLGYAVLSGLIEGLDLKVRFAISKSTVAAVFIAVFFVASEAAQQFFGATLGSSAVGIAAAGMLVFAMAPLQRAAERLAEKAVPVADADPQPSPVADRREETYRDAVRYTLRDGRMTHHEELHLARLATDLGLRPDRAVELRHEVEGERRRDDLEVTRG